MWWKSLLLLCVFDFASSVGIDGRVLPATAYQSNGQPYVITNTRLQQIRSNFMYWFYDQGGTDDLGDYQRDLDNRQPQILKDLNFQLPYFGSKYNNTAVSMHGYIGFAEPPAPSYVFPLIFPVHDAAKDPSFIGIFFSKCRLGNVGPTDQDQRRSGVYFRIDKDLQNRTDQLGVEMRERLSADIRQVEGSKDFAPKHAITVTWKNVTFEGGIDRSRDVTNTFQMVLATDEESTYAMFNYLNIQWTSHSEAGGDTYSGEGGVPAYVGFNAGNGIQNYEYAPYSQRSIIRDLTERGCANGFPGRHIFKIDDQISLKTSCKQEIDIDGRVLPITTFQKYGQPYVVTNTRLEQIRSNLMYWFYDQGGSDDLGDYQNNIQDRQPQINKNLDFQLPFFGFKFNYTRVSMNGYIYFSDMPDQNVYPLVFPMHNWPNVNDPSFIGIFFSQCRIGRIRPEDPDQRRPGVYFRIDKDLQLRTDKLGVEMRERLTWDIREGIFGSDTFFPKHAITVTWKNISFDGGIENSLYVTNTFQMVLATDEVFTYAIFNYLDINWTTHTEAGGDTTTGQGGVPAYVGFNAGNGSKSYEYTPFSQGIMIRDLMNLGKANGFQGRHLFRIDEEILWGIHAKDSDDSYYRLMFAPKSGNMLGGTVTIVNITGPYLEVGDRITCRFDTELVVGTVVDANWTFCVQPRMFYTGYANFEVAVNDEPFYWKGKYFVESPETATESISFPDDTIHSHSPSQFRIQWTPSNLTTITDVQLRISLWGYKETTTMPLVEYIDVIEVGVENTGEYIINPENFRNRENVNNDMQFGFLQINFTTPEFFDDVSITPVLWSRPIPLAWYFAPQWERLHGSSWAQSMCNSWLESDRSLTDFVSQPECPCTLQQALLDKGRFLPDPACDKDVNPDYRYNLGSIHCVRSGAPGVDGSGQNCCYDKNGFVMLSQDQMWGSKPQRSHIFGFPPYNIGKVPSLSHWFHDVMPFYQCCLWQEEQSEGCEAFRLERRPSQDCVAYQSPGVAGIFGDPHIVTFDDLQYTFNGKGEYVLVRVEQPELKLDVQARFEQVPKNIYGPVKATRISSVVAAANSIPIEVRLRPQHAQRRYRLSVFADKEEIYFDRPALRVQNFIPGMTVYQPSHIINQSQIIIMFSSGAGVEVMENNGFMSVRVYLPQYYMNKTRGLFGKWSLDQNDDFTRPDGTRIPVDLKNFQSSHRDFGQYWQLTDQEQNGTGAALFTREEGKTAEHYNDNAFVPIYIKEPADFLWLNRSYDVYRAIEMCGDSYQCRYDFGMTLNKELALSTKNFLSTILNIKQQNKQKVISCGALKTPRFGRKSTFLFTPGAKVYFECNQGYMLVGDNRRTCQENGSWNVPEFGYTKCQKRNEASFYGASMVIVLVVMCLVYVSWKVFRYMKYVDKEHNVADRPIQANQCA